MPSWKLISLAVLLNASVVFAQTSSAANSSIPSGSTTVVSSAVSTPIVASTSAAPAASTSAAPAASTSAPAKQAATGPVPSFRIHPNGNILKCLDVRGNVLSNGTPVQIFDCNGSPAQDWVLQQDETKVNLANTDMCLDAGSTPANNVGMKIWKCFDNLPAQDWFYTGDQRIALTNQGFCLDLTNGDLTNSNQVQTFHCTTGNTNQIWTLN